jgi:hypothetical protein
MEQKSCFVHLIDWTVDFVTKKETPIRIMRALRYGNLSGFFAGKERNQWGKKLSH